MFEAGLGDSEARAESDVSLPSSLSGKDIRLTSKVAFHDMAECYAALLGFHCTGRMVLRSEISTSLKHSGVKARLKSIA